MLPYGIDDGDVNTRCLEPHSFLSPFAEKQFTGGNFGYIPVGLEKKILKITT